MTLNGTLEDFSPAGILKVLSADARTGAVRFGGPSGCTVYLHRGQLYFARNDQTDGVLATALVRPGRLSADDWGQAIESAGDRPVVGELLVSGGTIAPDLLASVVLSVVYDPLIDLFRDGNGEFEFEPDTVHWLGPFRAFPVDAIVDEVRKRVREVDEWSSTIPSLDAWVEARRTLPGTVSQVTINREDWELVTALTGPRMISDLAGELGRGAYSTARVVHRLQEAGLVEVISADGHAEVVPIRRPVAQADVDAETTAEADPLLALGLPHRARLGMSEPDGTGTDGARDPAEITGDSDAVAVVTELRTSDLTDTPFATDAEGEESAGTSTMVATTATDEDDLFVQDDGAEATADQRWDESRLVANGGALHHEVLTPTPLAHGVPDDPNAAWLADLYAQFIDEPENQNQSKKRRRGEPNPVDVAFKSAEQDGEAKISTLKRLMGALKKL